MRGRSLASCVALVAAMGRASTPAMAKPPIAKPFNPASRPKPRVGVVGAGPELPRDALKSATLRFESPRAQGSLRSLAARKVEVAPGKNRTLGVIAREWFAEHDRFEALDFGSSYLWKVAQHAVIDELRRRRVRPEPASPGPEAVVGTSDPEVALKGQRITAGIDDCMQGIAPDRRAAVGLYLQGMSVPEVARALQWNRKRAENQVYRGLADLRRCLLSKGLRP